MGLETKRERVIYQGLVPIIAAVAGGIAATWYQSASLDQAHISDVVDLMRASNLSAKEKLQALDTYKEITDRPWAVIRSLVSYLGFAIMFGLGAGYFNRSSPD